MIILHRLYHWLKNKELNTLQKNWYIIVPEEWVSTAWSNIQYDTQKQSTPTAYYIINQVELKYNQNKSNINLTNRANNKK